MADANAENQGDGPRRVVLRRTSILMQAEFHVGVAVGGGVHVGLAAVRALGHSMSTKRELWKSIRRHSSSFAGSADGYGYQIGKHACFRPDGLGCQTKDCNRGVGRSGSLDGLRCSLRGTGDWCRWRCPSKR